MCNDFGRARDDARAKWSLLEQLDLTSQRLNEIPQLHWGERGNDIQATQVPIVGG